MVTARPFRPRPANRQDGDSRFVGMSAIMPAERLPNGTAQRIENLCVEPEGSLLSRPPFVGQFALSLGSALFGAAEFQPLTGPSRLVFGAVSGKLYKYEFGASAPVEITKAGGISANVSRLTFRFVRFGKWAFFLDAAGNLCRTDTATVENVAGLDAPTQAPTAQLTSRVINANANPGAWAGDAIPDQTNAQANPSFASTANGTYGPATSNAGGIAGWIVTNGAVFIQTASGDTPYPTGTKYALLQQAGTSMQSADVYAMPAVTNANGVGSVTRYAKHVKLSVNGFFKQSTDSLLLEVLGYTTTDGTGQVYVSFAYAANAPTTAQQGAAIIRQTTADLSGFGVEIRSYRLRVTAGPTNQNGAPGPYGTAFFAAPFELPVTFTGNGPITVYGNLPNASQTTLPIGGKILSLDLAPSGLVADRPDFSQNANLTIPFSSSNFAPGSPPRLRLGFRATAAATRYTSNLVTFAADLSSFSVDISTILAANRSSVRYLDLVLDADCPLANPLPAGQNALFSIGALTEAGRLSLIEGVGCPYQWLYAFYDADTGSTGDYHTISGIESGGSPGSAFLTPTTTQAQALLTVPTAPPANVTHIVWYRVGGVFTADTNGRLDPRLLAFVPVDANQTGASGYVWDFATRTLRDNVPDSALFSVLDFYETGRDKPPTNCTDLCVHDNRLFLVSGGQIYASWKLDGSDANALYFTNVSDPSDLEVYDKGDTFKLTSSTDGDKIAGLQPFGTDLIALRQRSFNVIQGDNATNWSSTPYLVGAGTGLLARWGFCAAFGGNRLWFAAAQGICEFQNNEAAPVSAPLEPLLSAQALTPATYANVALCAHDDQVFVFANHLAYVYDRKTASWVVFSAPCLVGATGAVSVASSGASHDLYICGGDGNLHKWAGRYGQAVSGGDKATSSGATTTIPTLLKTRRYPAPNGETQTPVGFSFDVETTPGSSQVLIWEIEARSDAPLASGPFSFTTRATPKLQSVGHVPGRSQEVTLSASVVEPFRVYGAGLVFSDNGQRVG